MKLFFWTSPCVPFVLIELIKNDQPVFIQIPWFEGKINAIACLKFFPIALQTSKAKLLRASSQLCDYTAL